MKTITPLLALTLSCIGIEAQTTIELYPSADCVVGFHDGENSANENAGNASHFSSFWQPAWTGVGENGGYGLIRFDFAGIPEGSEINAASLALHAFGDDFSPYLPDGHEGANACWLQRITEDWGEFTATWNTKPDMTADGQIAVPASTDPYEDYTIDITPFVQDMVNNPSGNFGFALKLQNESPTRGLMFHSSDATDEELWPTLTVTYSDPVPVHELQQLSFNCELFPNPATAELSIMMTGLESSRYSARIMNSVGTCVMNFNISNGSNISAITELPAGFYTLIITDDLSGASQAKPFSKL